VVYVCNLLICHYIYPSIKWCPSNKIKTVDLIGKAYKITMPDGSVVSGVTDASGATSLNSSDVIDNMLITLIKAQ